jgi:hypothetical protein
MAFEGYIVGKQLAAVPLTTTETRYQSLENVSSELDTTAKVLEVLVTLITGADPDIVSCIPAYTKVDDAKPIVK